MERPSGRWFESSDVVPMFPTLVWQLELKAELRESINARVRTVLERTRANETLLAPGKGWQSRTALHQLEELRELMAAIDDATRSVLRFLRIGYDAFEVTGCWATVLAPGASHRAHSHPNNFLSAVYYVQTDVGADTINFHDPRPQTGIIRPPVVELTDANTDQVVVRVKEGTLLLFPAYLQHAVEENRSQRERISLSFNIMFSSFTEKLAKPLW